MSGRFQLYPLYYKGDSFSPLPLPARTTVNILSLFSTCEDYIYTFWDANQTIPEPSTRPFLSQSGKKKYPALVAMSKSFNQIVAIKPAVSAYMMTKFKFKLQIIHVFVGLPVA